MTKSYMIKRNDNAIIIGWGRHSVSEMKDYLFEKG